MAPSIGAGGEFVPMDTGLSSGARPSFASTTVVTVRTEDDGTITSPLVATEEVDSTPEAALNVQQSNGGGFQRLFTAPNLPMNVHSYQFPASAPPPLPSNGMMRPPSTGMSVSAPGLTSMAPVQPSTIFAAPIPTSPAMLHRHHHHHRHYHQHQHQHQPPTRSSTQSSPSPDAPESPSSLSPPSSAASDNTSISEDSGDDEEQSRQTQQFLEVKALPITDDTYGKSHHEDQELMPEDRACFGRTAPVSIVVQASDGFAPELERPVPNPSRQTNRGGLSIHSDLLSLPSVVSSSSTLPLPSPPLSPLTELEFPQPVITPTSETSAMSLIEEGGLPTELEMAPSATFTTPPSISGPSTRSTSPSEIHSGGTATSATSPRSSEPSESIAAPMVIHTASGYPAAPGAKLLFEPLSLTGHVVNMYTSDEDEIEDSYGANVVEQPHQFNSPLVEDLIRSMTLSGHGPMFSSTLTGSNALAGASGRQSPNPTKTTDTVTTSAAATATPAATTPSSTTKPSRSFTHGHAKRPSMHAPSIIISPSINGNGFADGKLMGMAQRKAAAAAASMLPSPAPDSPLPGPENMTNEQRLRLLPEPHAPAAVDKEEEDMPLAWVQMRLRN
ncbi:hypothetical protein DFQ26_007585 [Actinomortierella ambigua]|nr:hypothetical protein DFQ26_007585 [Actinomortierella ambigua]